MNEVVSIKVQEDGSRVVESSLNKVAGASDKAGSSQEALEKILKQVSGVMDRVAGSLDRLNVTMSSSATVAARVAAAEEAAAKATAEMARANAAATTTVQAKAAATAEAAAANASLAESEAETSARIKAMVRSSLDQIAAYNAVEKSSEGVAAASKAQGAAQAATTTEGRAAASAYTATAAAQVRQAMAVEALDEALNGGIKTIQQWRDIEGQLVEAVSAGTITMSEFQRMTKKLDETLPSLTASIDKEARGVNALIGKYDPLSVKTAQLAKDELALKKARDLGIISATQYEKATVTLAAEQKAVAAASAASTTGLRLNSRATKELGVAAGEVATGNVGRLKQTLASLANQTGLLAKLMSPLGLSILGVVAALALFAVMAFKGMQQASELNKALIVTGNTSGITSGQINLMSKSMSDANQGTGQMNALLTGLVGTGKATSDTFGTVGVAAKNMLTLTGDSVDKVVDSFSNLYDDPIKWADDMDTKFHFLTLSVRDHAQALIDVGDKYGAAEVIAAAFAENTKDKVDALNKSMGTLERFMNNWANGVANIKQGLFNIGKGPGDAIQQFTEESQKYTAWLEKTKGLDSDYIRTVDAQFQARLKALQPAALDLQLITKTKEAQDENRKALLESGKVIDSINDKTKKQIDYQNKLKQLRESYQTAHNLGADMSNPRFAGVKFDADGNPSGGAYQSKVDELNKQMFGKPKVDHTSERAQKKYADDLKRLQDTIDPTAAAMKKLTDAQELLNKAVAKGDMTQNDADFALSLYQAQLFDAINPLEALNKKTDEQLTSLQNFSTAQTAATKAQKDANDMLKVGVVVDAEWLKQQEAKYVAIQKATDQQQVLQRIGKSVLKQQQDLVDTLTVLKNLQEKGPGNGGIDKQQAQQYLQQQYPEIYAGTSDLLNSQLALYESYYAKIDALQKAQFLSEKGADEARLMNKQRIRELEMQQASQTLGGIAQLMNTHSKKAFQIGKAAAIAQATINAYTSATGAYASASAIPVVGWILGPIAAAAAIAVGLANVSSIRSQQMPGFKMGGFTGNYGINDIVGAVHGKEYVMDAAATSRIGVQNLDALRAGAPVTDIGAGRTARSDSERPRSDRRITQNITQVIAGKPDRTTPMQYARALRRESVKELERD